MPSCLSVKMNLISLKYYSYYISEEWDSVQASWNLNFIYFQWKKKVYIKYHRWIFILDISWRLIFSEHGVRGFWYPNWTKHVRFQYIPSFWAGEALTCPQEYLRQCYSLLKWNYPHKKRPYYYKANKWAKYVANKQTRLDEYKIPYFNKWIN